MTNYLGVELLDVRPARLFDAAETVENFASVFESKAGMFNVEWMSTQHPWQRKFNWFCENRSDIEASRQFFSRRQGKFAPFWVPTWAADFLLLQPASSGSTEFIVSDSGFPFIRKHVVVITNSAIYPRQIRRYESNGDGTRTLELDSEIPEALSVNSTLISYLSYARLLEDEQVMDFINFDVAEIEIDWIETWECSEMLTSPSSIIPFWWKAPHKDAIYKHDFGGTYGANEEAWRAAFINDTVGDHYIQESASAGCTFDSSRKFNCHPSLLIPADETAQLLIQTELGLETDRFFERIWGRGWFWFPIGAFTPGTGAYASLLFMDLSTVSPAGNTDLYWSDEDPGPYPECWFLDTAASITGDNNADGHRGAPYEKISGIWLPVTMFAEDIVTETPTENRKEMVWVGSRRVINITRSPLGLGKQTFFGQLSCGSGLNEFNCGMLEFVNGGTVANPINPYSGLEGIS